MDFIKVVKYQLYLFQLENYELGRFLKLLLKKGIFLPKEHLRKKLVWTPKALAIFILSEVLVLAFAAIICRQAYLTVLENKAAIVFLFLGSVAFLEMFSWLFLIVAEIILRPVDYIFKQLIIFRAKRRLNKFPEIKIIGIAGSYGKTTMKQVLLGVLGAKFNVAATPDSVNTPVGIGRWILRKVDESTQIIIVEMGEHYKGDVEYLCKIAPPDISVVTGINEAHLERMGKIEIAVSTIFEIVSNTKPQGLVVLNGDDEKVMEHYKEYVWPDHELLFFGIKNKSNFKFNQEELGWDTEMEDLGRVFIGFLGEYALADAEAAVNIAKHLGMDNESIKRGIQKIRPVEHRLQPIQGAEGVLIIDDAYNGNSDGANEAVNVLSRFEGRRKIYITPGLVETGQKTEEVHREIGIHLAKTVNVVILIRNSVTPFIFEGINESTKNQITRTKPEIIWFNTAQEAHQSLPKILKPGDVVLFQNDWGDQYL